MATIGLFSWVVVPIVKFVKYLFQSPKLEHIRLRTFTVLATVATLVIFTLNFVPFPCKFKAPGVLRAINHTIAVNNVGGFVKDIAIKSGTRINKGTPILILK